jgi:5'-nucleotidase
MKILLTNDDGIGAEGLAALAGALRREHDVYVFAPDSERSGSSHALTLGATAKVRKIRDRTFSCSGTPSDCVVLAMLGVIGFIPEIVVSGINKGPNLGTDIVYSGTCAAAREAVLNGIPGIAVSCASRADRLRFGAAASFVSAHLEALASYCDGAAFVNVNAPSAEDDSMEALWSFPCRREYKNELESFEGPDGHVYCFITGDEPSVIHEAGSDFDVVSSGRVSVSPILVQPSPPSGFLPGRAFR